MRISRAAAVTFAASACGVLLVVAGVAWMGGSAHEPAIVAEPVVPEEPAPPLESFIAMRAAFSGFRQWTRYPVDGAMLPVGVEPGPTYVYVNRSPPRGEARWPVGTILVKVIEGGVPARWTIHAMVKRGVPYNPDGSVGWEFFELTYQDGDELAILWRGQGPPSGHGYAAMNTDAGPDPILLVCNDCHAASWQNDAVLTPALAIR